MCNSDGLFAFKDKTKNVWPFSCYFTSLFLPKEGGIFSSWIHQMTNNIFLNVHDYKKSVPLSDNIKYLIIMSHPSESDTKYTIKTKNNK